MLYGVVAYVHFEKKFGRARRRSRRLVLEEFITGDNIVRVENENSSFLRRKMVPSSVFDKKYIVRDSRTSVQI